MLQNVTEVTTALQPTYEVDANLTLVTLLKDIDITHITLDEPNKPTKSETGPLVDQLGLLQLLPGDPSAHSNRTLGGQANVTKMHPSWTSWGI